MSVCLPVVLICLQNVEDRRHVMYRAHERGMTVPDYVYIYFTNIPDGITTTMPLVQEQSNMFPHFSKQDRKDAFMAMKQVYNERN